MPQVTYRVLPADNAEWPRVRVFFDKIGMRHDIVPLPQFARACVAELDGEIIACWFVQATLHYEPLVVDAPHAGMVYIKSMMTKMEEAVAKSRFAALPAFAFVDSNHVERLATAVGFEKLDGVSIMCKSRDSSYVSGPDMKVA